jgi:hypothetical protein
MLKCFKILKAVVDLVKSALTLEPVFAASVSTDIVPY